MLKKCLVLRTAAPLGGAAGTATRSLAHCVAPMGVAPVSGLGARKRIAKVDGETALRPASGHGAGRGCSQVTKPAGGRQAGQRESNRTWPDRRVHPAEFASPPGSHGLIIYRPGVIRGPADPVPTVQCSLRCALPVHMAVYLHLLKTVDCAAADGAGNKPLPRTASQRLLAAPAPPRLPPWPIT